MAWNTLADLTTGGGIVEASLDAIRENIEHLGGLLGSLDGALQDKSAGASIGVPSPDWDSGWFAISHTSTYTKAHGLATIPRLIFIFVAASASPADGDYRVLVGSEHSSGADGVEASFNDTNIKLFTATTNIMQSDELGNLTSGGARIYAWV